MGLQTVWVKKSSTKTTVVGCVLVAGLARILDGGCTKIVEERSNFKSRLCST